MKYFLLLFISAFILSCNNSEGNVATATEDNSAPAAPAPGTEAPLAKIEWLDSLHQDLGSIKKGQVADITWKLKNTSDQPLIISDVAAGCGCTVVDKPQEPIAPGGEYTIKAKFDSNTQGIGENRKSIAVTSNTEQKNHTLTFRVDVKE